MISENFFASSDGLTFNRELALDAVTLLKFIQTTQVDEWQRLCKFLGDDTEKLFVQEFCAHVERTGMLETLRGGFSVCGCNFRALYWRPEPNIFTCVRQLHYSLQNQKSSDAVLFVNGLPLVTLELKDSSAGQNFNDAMEHYKRDCDPSEKFFRFGLRTLIHFAADNYRAAVTTKLEGASTKFLPFNPNSKSSTSACPLREILCKYGLLELLRNYLLVDGERIIFPYRHQLDVVTKLLAHVRSHGAGQNYLIRHSAGKSHSMAWLAQRLTNLRDAADEKFFSSVLVVTDRHTLERKLQDTVTQLEQVPALVVKVNTSAELRDALDGGKKIIVMTLKKFLAIYREVVAANKKFAIIIDEAHLSQSDAAGKIKPSPTDTALADEDFLDAKTLAYIDGLKRHFNKIEEVQAELEDAEFDLRPKRRIIAREFREAISRDKDANAYVKRLNLSPDELEEFIAEYALAKFKASKDNVITFSRAELRAFFNEYMSRKNSTEADDSFAEVKAKVDEQIHYLTTLARAAYEESNLPDAQDELLAELAAHGRQENLSFFAFSAAPKPQVSAFFGTHNEPFHTYSMRRAIDDGFILDVLKNYGTHSRDVDGQKNFASRQLHDIAAKTAVIMTEFVNKTRHKIGGRAKAMVVASSRLHAVKYFFAIKRYIAANNLSGVNVAIAFSGSVEDGTDIYSESSLNGFNENRLVEKFHGDEYNILVVAEKYLADFDEPLLHSMFVDKKLDGVKAVQILSRLNRTCAGKVDTFILDFVNDEDAIRKAFLPFESR